MRNTYTCPMGVRQLDMFTLVRNSTIKANDDDPFDMLSEDLDGRVLT